ncbi:glycosyltransferase family 4 protein [Arthrobacter sp. B0490]|uniref:glycosyltransferase family 4 protein n=1 Tax=Arthrobacter sp. B0490 TaxID=2058891 RepID=UPI000CE55DED|nr:glycosyltransferase family 4 protein [Arthrobacter sp. B0490]
MGRNLACDQNNRIKLLVLASPSTKNAGAYQFWDHLRHELGQQKTHTIVFRGHPDQDLVENEPLKLRLVSSLRFRKRVLQVIADEEVTHVISSISQSDIVFSFLLARKAKIPWFIYALGQPFPVKQQGHPVKRILWRFLWRSAARRAFGVLTVSEYLTGLLSDLLPTQKVETVYPGLPALEKEKLCRVLPTVADRLRVGFVGRLSPEKDPIAFCRIASANPTREFAVFGDGPMRADLEGAFNQVKFHGFTDRYRAFGQLDVMLITSISEGLPTILLEAGEAGVVPIVADVGGCAEAIHPLLRTRLVVPRAEREVPESWTVRIAALDHAEVRREYLILQRQWLTDTFDLSRTATSLMSILSKQGNGKR